MISAAMMRSALPRSVARCSPAAMSMMSTVADSTVRTHFREADPSKPKLVLAYSGGLDTSCQLSWLVKQKGFEVCAYIADLGQEETDSKEKLEEISKKAEESGAYAFYCEDARHEFVTDFVLPCIQSNAVYEGRYLLGTSIARPCISKRQIDVCRAEDAMFVSHGSTGKGNDQVRFELAYHALAPEVECVTLWRDPEYLAKFEGRQDLLDYAAENGIKVGATKKHSYSEDENLMHISYESGELEDPAYPGFEEYPGLVLQKKTKNIADTPDEPARLTIDFEAGVPSRVVNRDDGTEHTDPLDLYLYLNEIGGEHGVGRIDIVENRFVGMKSRGCYETPAGAILHAAHLDLELLTMDREVMRIRDTMSLKFVELVYNGYWYSPEMDFLMHSMMKAQEHVYGSVDIMLHKANIMPRGRSSPISLYNKDLVSMDKAGGFNAEHSTGFIRTLATRIKASKAREKLL